LSLKGKIAIITGGGRGLGREIAIALSEAGVRVAAASRKREELEKTVSIIADRGGQAMAVKADVSDRGDVMNLIRAVEIKFGPADILVNNAGVTGPVAPLKDVKAEEFDYCMEVNFKSALTLSQAVIPGMARKRYGKIINVTSGLAEFVMPRLGAYSISKAALNHMTRVLARELEDFGIKVYGLDPGTVDTQMQETLRGMDIKTLGPEAYRIFWTLKQSGQLRPPSEVARLAVFLASEEADNLSGEIGTESHFMKWGYRIAA